MYQQHVTLITAIVTTVSSVTRAIGRAILKTRFVSLSDGDVVSGGTILSACMHAYMLRGGLL